MDEWYQQALTPPQVLECNIRVGIIPTEDHAQALVELKDPTTGVLIAQWANPHVGLRDLDRLISQATAKAHSMTDYAVEPFT